MQRLWTAPTVGPADRSAGPARPVQGWAAEGMRASGPQAGWGPRSSQLNMTRSRRRPAAILVALLLLGAIVGRGTGGRAEPSGALRLLAAAETLLQASNDLLSIAEDRIEHTAEHQIASDLGTTASACAEYLGAAADFLRLYEAVSTASDRIRVKGIVNARLTYYAKLIDNRIKLVDNRMKLVNLRLSRPQSQGFVETGARLRGMLQDSAALLRSLEIP